MIYAVSLALLCAILYVPGTTATVTSCVQCTDYAKPSLIDINSAGCVDGTRASESCGAGTYTSCSKEISYDEDEYKTVIRRCNSEVGVNRCTTSTSDDGKKRGTGYTCHCVDNSCNGAAGVTISVMLFLSPFLAKLLW